MRALFRALMAFALVALTLCAPATAHAHQGHGAHGREAHRLEAYGSVAQPSEAHLSGTRQPAAMLKGVAASTVRLRTSIGTSNEPSNFRASLTARNEVPGAFFATPCHCGGASCCSGFHCCSTLPAASALNLAAPPRTLARCRVSSVSWAYGIVFGLDRPPKA